MPGTGGELAAFRELLERWFDPCVDVAWQVLHDVDAAAEVTQDAFATAWHAQLARKPADEAGTFLMRATRDSALGRLAQQRHAEPDSEPWPSSGAPALGDQPGRDPDADLLRAVSAALGESDASVLDLHLRHGFSVDQVAHALGAPRNDTQQLLMRLKRRLGRAVRAWALWRDGRPDATGCAELRLALDGNGVRGFGPEAVTVIARHAKVCERCQDRQRLTGTPESLVAAVPIVPAGTVVAARAAEALRARGIPLDPPTDGSGVASPAGTGAPPPERVPASSSGFTSAGAPAVSAPAPPSRPPPAAPTATQSGSPAAPAGPGAAAAYASAGAPPTVRDSAGDVRVPPSPGGPRSSGDAWPATAAGPVTRTANGETAAPLTGGQPAARPDGAHLWSTAVFASPQADAPRPPTPAPPAPGWATPPSGDPGPAPSDAERPTPPARPWSPQPAPDAGPPAPPMPGDAWAADRPSGDAEPRAETTAGSSGASAGLAGASSDTQAHADSPSVPPGRSGDAWPPTATTGRHIPSGDAWTPATTARHTTRSDDAWAPATTARHTTRSDDAWAPIATTAATAGAAVGAASDAWAPLRTTAGHTGASGDPWAPVGTTDGAAARSGDGSARGHSSGDEWAAGGGTETPGAGQPGQDGAAPFGTDREPAGGRAGRRGRKWPALAAAALLLLVVGSVGAMALSGGDGAGDELAGGGTTVATATTVSPGTWTVPEGAATTAPGPGSPTTTAGPGTDPTAPTPTTADPSTSPRETTTTVSADPAGSRGAPDILTFRVVSQTLGTPCAAEDRRVTLAWESPDAETVTLDGPGAPSGAQPSSGSAIVCRPQGDPVTYTLTATGPGGTATRTTTV